MDWFEGKKQTDSFTPAQPENKEKNYFYLERRELPFIDLSRYRTHETGYGKLYISVTALQDLFIGCGEIENCGGGLVDAFSYVTKAPGDRTFNIPGSSMKGCILTNLSLFLNERSTGFFSTGEGPAKVFFTDLPMTGPGETLSRLIPGRFSRGNQPRDAQVKLYSREDRAYGTLSEFEIKNLPELETILSLNRGCRFEGFINFKRLDRHELAFLVLALGCLKDHRFNFKMGGAKNRGMGLVRVSIDITNSVYSRTLTEAARGTVSSFKTLEDTLVSIIHRVKHDYPNFLPVLDKLRKEYGK